MYNRTGTFIVIEGTDGSGKATQFELLCDRLRQTGYDVATFDFPQYSQPSSYFVKQYLNGEYGGIGDVGPYTASLFYALDRYEAADKIEQALAEGKVVVSNRFTGSSMGHQGTKFRSAEERRGFFIWLDNLEFEMLQIPRPDISFVLRVPADVAHELIGKKEARDYTDKARDIHEADIAHLEKSVEVYDDLTQLFPKDFQRIDCVRSDKLLDIDTIQNLLWEKITVLLPPPLRPEAQPDIEPPQTAPDTAGTPSAAAVAAPATTAAEPPASASAQNTPSPKEPRSQNIVVENASHLLAQRLEACCPVANPDQPLFSMDYTEKDAEGNYRYHTPKDMDVPTTQKYHAFMVQIFDLYTDMTDRLARYLADNADTPAAERTDAWKTALQAQVAAATLPVLPAATKTTVTVQAADRILEDLVVELLDDDLPEARTLGQALLRGLPEIAPALVAHAQLADSINAAVTYRASTQSAIQTLAQEYLPDNHAAETLPVQLADVWPRNEMDLLPGMLYEHSNLPLAQLATETTAWPYNRKLDVFEAYLGTRQNRSVAPGRALEKARYSWDLLTEYSVFRELQHAQAIGKPEWQPLTPRYGYDIPKIIEKAGLADQFERCFDLSLELYSLLQQAGHASEAQYATLMGHKLRWKLGHNARDAFRLYELPVSAAAQRIVQQMHARLGEVHPLLAEAVRFSQPD